VAQLALPNSRTLILIDEYANDGAPVNFAQIRLRKRVTIFGIARSEGSEDFGPEFNCQPEKGSIFVALNLYRNKRGAR
jgi:hypothetical protein